MADPNMKNSLGATPFRYSSDYGHTEVVKYFMDNFENLGDRDYQKRHEANVIPAGILLFESVSDIVLSLNAYHNSNMQIALAALIFAIISIPANIFVACLSAFWKDDPTGKSGVLILVLLLFTEISDSLFILSDPTVVAGLDNSTIKDERLSDDAYIAAAFFPIIFPVLEASFNLFVHGKIESNFILVQALTSFIMIPFHAIAQSCLVNDTCYPVLYDSTELFGINASNANDTALNNITDNTYIASFEEVILIVLWALVLFILFRVCWLAMTISSGGFTMADFLNRVLRLFLLVDFEVLPASDLGFGYVLLNVNSDMLDHMDGLILKFIVTLCSHVLVGPFIFHYIICYGFAKATRINIDACLPFIGIILSFTLILRLEFQFTASFIFISMLLLRLLILLSYVYYEPKLKRKGRLEVLENQVQDMNKRNQELALEVTQLKHAVEQSQHSSF